MKPVTKIKRLKKNNASDWLLSLSDSHSNIVWNMKLWKRFYLLMCTLKWSNSYVCAKGHFSDYTLDVTQSIN